jgi:hypothetical protein
MKARILGNYLAFLDDLYFLITVVKPLCRPGAHNGLEKQ